MNDDSIDEVIRQARRALDRLDTSAAEFGFETRLLARLQSGVRNMWSPVRTIWRSVAGLSAAVTALAFWFTTVHGTAQSVQPEEELADFWTGGETVLAAELDIDLE